MDKPKSSFENPLFAIIQEVTSIEGAIRGTCREMKYQISNASLPLTGPDLDRAKAVMKKTDAVERLLENVLKHIAKQADDLTVRPEDDEDNHQSGSRTHTHEHSESGRHKGAVERQHSPDHSPERKSGDDKGESRGDEKLDDDGDQDDEDAPEDNPPPKETEKKRGPETSSRGREKRKNTDGKHRGHSHSSSSSPSSTSSSTSSSSVSSSAPSSRGKQSTREEPSQGAGSVVQTRSPPTTTPTGEKSVGAPSKWPSKGAETNGTSRGKPSSTKPVGDDASWGVPAQTTFPTEKVPYTQPRRPGHAR